jgi:hypothetical protein
MRRTWFCRKCRFRGKHPTIGSQQFNDLQTPKCSKKHICDRTFLLTICYFTTTLVSRHHIGAMARYRCCGGGDPRR